MITHCNESSMIDRQSNKELKPICEKMLCFLQGLLRRGGPQVPHHLARRNARKRLNPPTTACGVTSVFETPSALRESLPSYSAKPGAFYAPRALRWTTPPRGRTDPFQGPKIKPNFHRCSMLFQDDEHRSLPRRSRSQVAGRCRLGVHFGGFLGSSEP